MVQLVTSNSYSKIMGLSPEQGKALSSLLSYTVGGKSAFFSRFGPKRRSLLSKKWEFPTGLMHRVVSFLYKNNIRHSLSSLSAPLRRRIHLDSSWTGIIPYEAQMAAVAAAVGSHRGIISMPTGTGKSLVIAMIANELKVRTLIVVPSLEIKKQLTESLKLIFKDMSWLTIENIDSKALKTAINYDCLIIDEAHHAAAKTYQKLNKTAWTGIYYRFFLTATPFRNDPEEELLFESIAGEIIYKLSYKEAISKGYIVPVDAYYLEVPKQGTDAYTYAEVYSQLVVHNLNRNVLISNLLYTLKINSVCTLCLVREVAHGHLLSGMTGAPFVHGEDDESRDYIRQFNTGEIKALIGTTGMLGEGIDTKPAEYVIIAGLGKAKSQFMQQVGRGVRKYPGKESCKVILVKDKSHKFLTRHFNAQSAILVEEYGIKPLKLEMFDE